ncbi:hypothetical protein J1N10_20345 [Carboxylicivirga sp. A043]|uniref:hypothetical protein n=1 Tax=Carboxylicivirga litoralis TaxID=2816963 RepID=UPI0021CB0A13|nr:hypothetical protein [Carboxylicivirga sp. A043]MCU4158336.1 hypothetical protein [Carboxylicivirga sp. A043]
MMWLKKHIALWLTGLFIFPILYQPLHVVLHHSSRHAHHHCCAHKHCQVHANPKQSNAIKVSSAEDTCPICDYHFATKDVANPPIERVAILVITNDYNDFATQQKYIQPFSNKSPRAPPASINLAL